MLSDLAAEKLGLTFLAKGHEGKLYHLKLIWKDEARSMPVLIDKKYEPSIGTAFFKALGLNLAIDFINEKITLTEN